MVSSSCGPACRVEGGGGGDHCIGFAHIQVSRRPYERRRHIRAFVMARDGPIAAGTSGAQVVQCVGGLGRSGIGSISRWAGDVETDAGGACRG